MEVADFMKKTIQNTIIAGVLCAALTVPSFVHGAGVEYTPDEDVKIIPVSQRLNHWAERYIAQLAENYDIGSIFEKKDLNAAITLSDFQNLVQLVIDKEYDGAPDSLSREAVVHELVRIWAEKTGQDLDTIAVIMIAFYSDTEKIDPKYNHSVSLAYVKNIARGDTNGAFNPKDKVKYGELAALISNTVNAIENELKSGESILDKGIAAGNFETKGSYIVKDDKVVFDFELTSNYTETKTLQFGSGQQYEIVITDEKGEEVYRYSDGKFFTMALIYKDINPGESIKWQEEWDMTNKDGEKLTSGKYKAEISIMAALEQNEEKIEESQLNTVLEFSLGAQE